MFDPKKKQTGRSIPEWMLDEKRCPSGMIRSKPCFSEDALFSLQHVLDEIISSRQIDKNLLNTSGEYLHEKKGVDTGGAVVGRTDKTDMG